MEALVSPQIFRQGDDEMKKILATLLALAMVLSLAACCG